MKPTSMTFEEVYAQLEAFGSPGVRAVYARQGAGENQFGVKLGDLRGLAKKIKTDHALALRLWETGNADARILATMLFDPLRLSQAEVEQMAGSITYAKVIDELIFNAVQNTPFAGTLRDRWIDSPDDLLGRAGWNLMIATVTGADPSGPDYPALMVQIEREMAAAPTRKMESMNRCLVEIALRFPDLTQECIAIGERVGPVDKRKVHKGCTAPYAPEWIAAVLAKR